jgi:NADH-quinone oxidoreductase subunit L
LFLIKTSSFGKKTYKFLNRKWFFDKLYNEYFGQFFFKFGYSTSYKFVDRGIFEILGPTGLSTTALTIGNNLHKMQTGFIYHYTLLILLGATLIFSIRQFWLIFGFFVDYRLFVLIFILFFFIVNLNEKK